MWKRPGLALAAGALLLAACGRPAAPPPPVAPPVPAPPGPGASAAERLPPRPFAGSPAPGWSGVDVRTGRPVAGDSLKGSVALINFWATWCAPCKVEMPEIEAAARELGGQLRVVAIGVDRDETREQLKAYADQLGVTFTVVWDGGRAKDEYQVFAVPTSFFLDRRGIVRTRYTGVMNRELIRQLVADAAKYE